MAQNGRKDDGDTRRERTPSLPSHESIVQRLAPRAKAVGNCRSTIVPTRTRLQLFFTQIISVNQLSLYGAVSDMCGEYDTCHERTERLVVMKQSSSSLALSVIKTEVLWIVMNPANKDLRLLQQYGERIEKLSQQDKLSKFVWMQDF